MDALTTTRLDADEIIELGSRMAGVADPEPAKFRDNLASLIAAINDQDPPTPEGAEASGNVFVRSWANRIAVDDWNRRAPGIGREPIAQPIAMVGLPRSGSTYFQYLFSHDPSVRMLRTWEGLAPCPPPALEPETVSPRIEALARAARNGVAAVPLRSEAEAARFHAMHLTDLEGPQECVGVMNQTFANIGDYWRHSVPDYFASLRDDRSILDVAYDHHKRVLQTLQFGGEAKRWVLKWPCHLMGLDSLVRTYPDVRMILTHRDPVKALASNCSLALFIRRGLSQDADPIRVGRDMRQLFAHFIDALMAFDRRTDLLPLVHVDYYALRDNPADAMARAFDDLDLPFTAETRDSVAGWRESNPQGKRGRHDYQLSDFGLREEEIAEQFADYIARFDIRREA